MQHQQLLISILIVASSCVPSKNRMIKESDCIPSFENGLLTSKLLKTDSDAFFEQYYTLYQGTVDEFEKSKELFLKNKSYLKNTSNDLLATALFYNSTDDLENYSKYLNLARDRDSSNIYVRLEKLISKFDNSCGEDAVLEEIKELYEIHPTNFWILKELQERLLYNNHSEIAQNYLMKYPCQENINLKILRSNILLNEEKYEEAVEVLTSLYATNKSIGLLHLLTSAHFFYMSDWEASLKLITDANQEDNLLFYTILGHIKIAQGDYGGGEQYFEKVHLNNQSSQSILSLIWFNLAMGKLSDSKRYLDEYVNSNYLITSELSGYKISYYLMIDDYQEAQKLFNSSDECFIPDILSYVQMMGFAESDLMDD